MAIHAKQLPFLFPVKREMAILFSVNRDSRKHMKRETLIYFT
jgi:hypothetical protein